MVIIILNFVLLRWMDHRRPDLSMEGKRPGSDRQRFEFAAVQVGEL